ncbi:MAG: 23S rRNA pseudouridine(1911/1915/1917) synthase RluD [Proteobacteria bacterium]|nr:23S rRNA pseudouridine(1911/1915/1917) synthase RluD [Pseudomonadota bacterium]
MSENFTRALIVTEELDQKRLDQVLAAFCWQYSRSRLQQWIRSGFVQLDGKIETKPRTIVSNGQKLLINAKITPTGDWQPQALPLNIRYQDKQLIIVDKPAGLVVHPGAGTHENTLVNALLHFDPTLAAIPRAGLVHRLDKETSGLLVVARDLPTHHYLVKCMQLRQIKREYFAIVHGHLVSGGSVQAAIGRHPSQRTKMAVVASGKPAVTHYRIIEKFTKYTAVQVQLETGRTHQIRVHFTHIRHPLVGDPLYGKPFVATAGMLPALRAFLNQFHRQALHAVQLSLVHPGTQQMVSWTSPLPDDLQQLLQLLHEDKETKHDNFR